MRSHLTGALVRDPYRTPCVGLVAVNCDVILLHPTVEFHVVNVSGHGIGKRKRHNAELVVIRPTLGEDKAAAMKVNGEDDIIRRLGTPANR